MPGKAVPTPEKARGTIKRLENVVATKPFLDAMQNLADDGDALEEVKRDPGAYLKGFGVNLPDEAEVRFEEHSPWCICIQIWIFRICYCL